jgi:hypothetical protein
LFELAVNHARGFAGRENFGCDLGNDGNHLGVF